MKKERMADDENKRKKSMPRYGTEYGRLHKEIMKRFWRAKQDMQMEVCAKMCNSYKYA